MPETEVSVHVCDAAVTLAFSVLGKRWNGMIVATLGGGRSSFAALRRAVDGISDTVLSDRLSELAQTGLIARTVEAGPPVSVSYELTESGRGLLPILDQLGRWATANLAPQAH
ncbi:winged helix-turn-helix transcriptional regulator [Microbacterium sp. NPDC056234]|uniref:winged helix-turn-helix transcriptional regulator n=1 Tax=Microbacterium sp. NPDC056234 TaxID=3345757 RepID=UPI0035DA314C